MRVPRFGFVMAVVCMVATAVAFTGTTSPASAGDPGSGSEYLVLAHKTDGTFSFVNVKDRSYSWGAPNCDLASQAQRTLNGKAVTWNDITDSGARTKRDISCSQMNALLANASTDTPTVAEPGTTNSLATPILNDYEVNGLNFLWLDWQEVEGATKYNVFRNGQIVRTVPTNAFGVASHPGGSFRYHVVAVDDSGSETKFSKRSDDKLVTIVQQPGGVRAVETDSGVAVTWESAVGADTYRLFRNGREVADQSATRFVDRVGAGSHEYVVVGYRRDGKAMSPASWPAKIRVGTVHMKLNAVPSGDGTMLSWRRPPGAEPTAIVTSFVRQGDDMVAYELETTDTSIAAGSGAFGFMVSYGDEDVATHTSGLVSPGGDCLMLCNAGQLDVASSGKPFDVVESDATIVLRDSDEPENTVYPLETNFVITEDGLRIDVGDEQYWATPDGLYYLVDSQGRLTPLEGGLEDVETLPGPTKAAKILSEILKMIPETVFDIILSEGIEDGWDQLSDISKEKPLRRDVTTLVVTQEFANDITVTRETDLTTGRRTTVVVVPNEDSDHPAQVITVVSTRDVSAPGASPRTNVTTVYEDGQVVEVSRSVVTPTGLQISQPTNTGGGTTGSTSSDSGSDDDTGGSGVHPTGYDDGVDTGGTF